jgi:hypothetical protein
VIGRGRITCAAQSCRSRVRRELLAFGTIVRRVNSAP